MRPQGYLTMAKPSDIPNLVYDNLRAVHESRVRRTLDADDRASFEVERIPNSRIFLMMPDHKDLNWTEGVQPRLTMLTLEAMFATVEFPQ